MDLTLLIVDDNTHFLDAARGLLEREGLSVVGVASTIEDAVRRVHELGPDVTLVDIDLGDENGFDLAIRLTDATQADPGRVILISAYPQDDLAELIDASPAVGFLSKSRLSAAAIVELLRSD